ncbi:ABC-2 transporter permease [Bacillus sp. FJAT-42315]|uniref:ABC-2 transporter permease n=1 Tax=Bacillus sp. FJAT-42315 TaxID=2014077 RepID=UPI001E576221|nr:ABC-2 transporter permease [Bacillus sp. FJAT-42315]
MRHLMRLNVQSMNRLLLFMTPLIFLSTITTASHSYQFIVFVFAVSGYYVMISNLPNKENPDSSLLIHTLPVTRAQIVVAKYIGGLKWFLIAFTIYLIVAGGLGGFIAPVPKWQEIIIVLSMLLGVMSIFYPLYYRWGYYAAIAANGPIILLFFMSSSFYPSVLPNLFNLWLTHPSFLFTFFGLAMVAWVISLLSSIRLFEAHR